jgi:hypothetical protein
MQISLFIKSFTLKTFQTYSITGLVPVLVNYFFVFTPLKGLSHKMDLAFDDIQYMVRNYAGPGSALNHKSMRVRKLALPYRTELIGKDSTVTLTPTLGYYIGHKKNILKLLLLVLCLKVPSHQIRSS